LFVDLIVLYKPAGYQSGEISLLGFGTSGFVRYNKKDFYQGLDYEKQKGKKRVC